MKSPVVFDGRNLFDPHKMASLGIAYFGIGRSGRLSRKR
jgi:UDPglucose 6-dehydrogenase